MGTRQKTFRHLRELYALDTEIALWRVARFLWARAPAAERPLLALIVAYAREPLLRLTWELVGPLPLQHALTPAAIDAFVERARPGQYNSKTRISTAQHIASAWAQSGHLSGHNPKLLARAGRSSSHGAGVVARKRAGFGARRLFSLALGGFARCFPRAVDKSAFEAHKFGWLDYRRIERAVQLDFSRLVG